MGNDEILKAELEKAVAECERLREENARLRVRVGQAPDTRASHASANNTNVRTSAAVTVDSRPEPKVSLFKDLFRGRDDVYAVRWEGKSGKTGYSPAGIREWVQAASTKLASAVLTRTMERRYAVGLDSYDRLFPSQDTMPKGGNLIALPLQHGPREKGNCVLVDDQLRPYDDQWAFLSSIKRLAPDDVQQSLPKVCQIVPAPMRGGQK